MFQTEQEVVRYFKTPTVLADNFVYIALYIRPIVRPIVRHRTDEILLLGIFLMDIDTYIF